MPASVYHAYTNVVADGTATSVVRPSDWNSAHVVTLAPTGAEIIGAFSNGGNVTFGTNTAGYVTASAPAGGTGGGGGVAVSAGTNSTNTGTVAFVNSNGVSFGMNTNAQITASVDAQAYVFSNSNNVSFGTNGSTVTATATFAQSADVNKAGTGFTSAGANVSFSGTLGTNGLSLSGSVAAQSVQPVAFSASGGSSAFSTLYFANSNGVTFSNTNGSVRVTHDLMNTSERGNYFYTSNNTFANSTHSHGNVAFSGTNVSGSFTSASNGLSINLSVGAGGAGDGYNSAQFTNSTANSTMPLLWAGNSNGSGNVTIGLTGSTITMSAPSGGGAGDGYNIIGVNGGATQLSTTYQFNNANNVSFGLNAGTITASASYAAQTADTNKAGTGFTSAGNNIGLSGTLDTNGLQLSATVAAQTVQPVAYSAANGSANFSTLTFANSNGVSFSTGTQGVYATVKTDYQSSNANYLTSQSNQAVSAANGSFTFQTVTFANSNGVSFSTGTQGVYASHNGITQQSTQPVAYSAANGSANFSTLTFANSNGVSFSTGTQGLYATVRTDYQSSNANYLTSQSNQALSAANGSFTFQTATFANSNGVSFSTGTQGIYATVKTDYLTTARASNDAIGLNTAQTNVTWTVGSNGLSLNAAGYAGTGTTYAGTNVNATLGLNSNGLALSLSAAGGGTINQTGPNIADGNGNTITSGTVVFSNANGVSFGLNGSTMTASVNAGGGAAVLSYFDNVEAVAAGATLGMSSRVSQASTIWLFPLNRDGFPGNMTVQTAQFNVYNSGNTNSISAALTYTWGLGIYQVTDVTRLTLIRKASSVWTQSANVSYSQSLVGQRWLSFHSTQFSNTAGVASNLELSEGGRYVGALSISSAGSAIQTHNFIGEYMYSTNARSGHMGVLSVTGTSKGFFPWLGQFSATSTAFPNSIGYNQINKQVASGNFRPQLIFNNLGDLG